MGIKKIAGVFLVCALFVSAGNVSAYSLLQWQATTVQLLDHSGAPLTAGADDTVGSLVQLVYAGLDGIIDAAVGSNVYGVSNDDTIAAYAWIGRLVPPAFRPGRFIGPDYDNYRPNGSKYYVRTWEGVSRSSGTGQIPLAPSFYGDSGLFTVTGNTEPPGFEEFFVTTPFSTTSLVVPEPATFAFFAIAGLFAFIKRRFIK